MLPDSVMAQPEVQFEFDRMIGSQGFEVGRFNSPVGVDFLSNGRVIVADRSNHRVQSCDDEGNCQRVGGIDPPFGFTRRLSGVFDYPFGIEVDSRDRFIVADEDNHWVQSCDTNNSCIFAGESTGLRVEPSQSLAQFAFPDDVAVDNMDWVYVADTGNNRIQLFDAELNFRDIFGRKGSAVGEFNQPQGISVDQQGRIVIADTGNNRIQICQDMDGDCFAFGGLGSGEGQFNAPTGVEVDQLGRIWVADTGNHRIQVCNETGACVAFGDFGVGQGQFDSPSDVAVSQSGRVAVVDTNNHRIQFFSTGAFQINAGLNDAWFNPSTDGQGFFITVFPDLGLVLLAWFTYDTELPADDVEAILGDPGHRWLTAVGQIDGNQAVLDIEIASGGIFDTSSEIQRSLDGTITLTFEHCNSGTVDYSIPSINRQGSVPIVRVARDNVALCETLAGQ